jgi:hypothetical protein
MKMIPMGEPIKNRGEPSGLEPIQIEEITDPENHRVPSPQIISPGTIPTQPEVSRTPGGTGAPKSLFDLITIYDDEESSKVSIVTPVLITEEKEPEKESTPSPDAPIQNLP